MKSKQIPEISLKIDKETNCSLLWKLIPIIDDTKNADRTFMVQIAVAIFVKCIFMTYICQP